MCISLKMYVPEGLSVIQCFMVYIYQLQYGLLYRISRLSKIVLVLASVELYLLTVSYSENKCHVDSTCVPDNCSDLE
jgi:hypothetical protein